MRPTHAFCIIMKHPTDHDGAHLKVSFGTVRFSGQGTEDQKKMFILGDEKNRELVLAGYAVIFFETMAIN